MLSIIPEDKYKNPDLKWLDPGSGSGNFSIVLYYKLLDKFFIKINKKTTFLDVINIFYEKNKSEF